MTIKSRLEKLENATAADKYVSCPVYDGETEQEAMAAAGITEEPSGLLVLVRHWCRRPVTPPCQGIQE